MKQHEISLLEALFPGWDTEWIVLKNNLLIVSGTSGQRIPVDESHHSKDPKKGTEIMARVEERRRAWTFGQDCWRIDISWIELEIPGTEGGGLGRDPSGEGEGHLRHHQNLWDQGTNRSRLRRTVGWIWTWKNWGWIQLRVWSTARWYFTGQSICNYIFCTWKVNDLAVELRDVWEMMLPHGEVILNKAWVKGLWSEKRTNLLPFSKNRKWRRAE